jgi:vitamin B12 transporter
LKLLWPGFSTDFTRGKLETLVNEKTRIIVKWNNEFNLVNSNNYTGHKTRNISTFTAIALKPFSKRLNASLLISEILDNNKLLYPDFSTGMEIRLSEINDRNLKINFSRNTKAPSLNDLFWNPGGNPQLKNEYSYSGEISFLSKSNILKSLTLNTEITLFTSRIGDMIQWVPGEYSYWTPVNIAKVNTSGAESSLAFIYKMNGFTMKLNCEYTFNRSYIADANADVSSGGQLIYVPVNMFNGAIKLIFRNFYTGCNTSYTGKRYTDADNLQYLPGYIVTHLVTGFTMNKGVHSFSMSFKAENIFGKRYEVVAYYPMPGRSFLLSVSYKFGR